MSFPIHPFIQPPTTHTLLSLSLYLYRYLSLSLARARARALSLSLSQTLTHTPQLVAASSSLDAGLWPSSARGPSLTTTDTATTTKPKTETKTDTGQHALVADGLRVAEDMREEARIRARALEMRTGRRASLAIVTVGPGHPQVRHA